MRKDTDMFTNFASFRNQLRKKIVSKLHNKQFNFLGVKLQQKKTPTKTMSINRETRDNQSFKRKNVFTMNVSTGKLLDGKQNYFSNQLSMFQKMKKDRFNIKSFSLMTRGSGLKSKTMNFRSGMKMGGKFSINVRNNDVFEQESKSLINQGKMFKNLNKNHNSSFLTVSSQKSDNLL